MPCPSHLNPYTPEHYKILKESQRKLGDYQSLLDSAESCGLECQNYRNLSAQMHDLLTRLETEFFPNPPMV